MSASGSETHDKGTLKTIPKWPITQRIQEESTFNRLRLRFNLPEFSPNEISIQLFPDPADPSNLRILIQASKKPTKIPSAYPDTEITEHHFSYETILPRHAMCDEMTATWIPSSKALLVHAPLFS